MAEVKYVDPWNTDKKDWEYVEVPKKNILGKPHAGGALNNFKFEAGQKYFVPPVVAREVERILSRYNADCLRQIRPEADSETLAQLESRGFENVIQEPAG